MRYYRRRCKLPLLSHAEWKPAACNSRWNRSSRWRPTAARSRPARSFSTATNWTGLGQSDDALWGLCQGSAVYQVKVELGSLGYHCSCPSRKFPCKHVLGLLMLRAASPAAIAAAEAPEWVGEWIEKRRARENKKASRSEADAAKPVNEQAQQRRAQQRESRVADGLGRLDVWLKDLVRNGLAGLETKPPAFWEDQAKRLVDAGRRAWPRAWHGWRPCRVRRAIGPGGCWQNWDRLSCCSMLGGDLPILPRRYKATCGN